MEDFTTSKLSNCRFFPTYNASEFEFCNNFACVKVSKLEILELFHL